MVKIEKEKPEGLIDDEEARYPWGTRLDLEDELVDEVGVGDMNVGDEVRIVATGFIQSTSDYKRSDGDGGESRKTVAIQFTELGVSKDEKTSRSTALYGDSE